MMWMPKDHQTQKMLVVVVYMSVAVVESLNLMYVQRHAYLDRHHHHHYLASSSSLAHDPHPHHLDTHPHHYRYRSSSP
jgi:hypothetical protein